MNESKSNPMWIEEHRKEFVQEIGLKPCHPIVTKVVIALRSDGQPLVKVIPCVWNKSTNLPERYIVTIGYGDIMDITDGLFFFAENKSHKIEHSFNTIEAAKVAFYGFYGQPE